MVCLGALGLAIYAAALTQGGTTERPLTPATKSTG